MKDDDDNSESDNSDGSTSSKSEDASHRHNTSKVRSLLRKKNGRENGSDGRNRETTHKCKRGRARRGRKDVINRREAPRVIIDPGTDIDVIGGVRWCIINVADRTTANLGGALAGMG